VINSLDLLIPLVVYRPNLLELIESWDNLDDLVVDGLLNSNSENVRISFEVALTSMFNMDTNISTRHFFLTLMLKLLPNCETVMPHAYNYFNLLISLVSI
jgi:hypothetical protein